MPMGGFSGGVEDVTRQWMEYFKDSSYILRIFHMSKNNASYLNGYEHAYFVNKILDEKNLDIDFGVCAYHEFIQAYGEPRICIAMCWPIVTQMCMEVRKRYGYAYKILSWGHGSIWHYEKYGFGGAINLAGADEYIALSRNIEAEIKVEKPNAIVHVVGNPIEYADLYENADKEYELAFVGRFAEEKRIDLLLEALYKSKHNWRLKLIGDGVIREEIEGWISLLKLEDRVEICGWQTDPFALCNKSAALVISSDSEGFPLVALQASARGMTIISTPVSGVIDYIDPGENGYLFEHDNADSLVKVLNKIGDGELPICDPIKCAQSIDAYYYQNYFKKIEEILEGVLANKNAAATDNMSILYSA